MVNYCFFVMNVAQEQIIPLVNLVNEICEIGFLPEDKYVGDWLTEPREFLDDKSPIELVNEKNMDKLWHLIRFIEIGEADAWESIEHKNA